MTTDKPSRSGRTLVAIDIAKYRNEILIEVPSKARRRRLTILNNLADHDRLLPGLPPGTTAAGYRKETRHM